MPLDRVPGEQFDVLVDHADGPAGHPCSCGTTPFERHLLQQGPELQVTECEGRPQAIRSPTCP